MLIRHATDAAAAAAAAAAAGASFVDAAANPQWSTCRCCKAAQHFVDQTAAKPVVPYSLLVCHRPLIAIWSAGFRLLPLFRRREAGFQTAAAATVCSGLCRASSPKNQTTAIY